MGGKASLFLVIGFSLIFMIAGRNFNNMAGDTTDNMINYFYDTKTHQMAASGINLVVSRLYTDINCQDGTYNFNFDGGAILVTLRTTDYILNKKELISVGSITTGGKTYSSTFRVIMKPSYFSKFAYFSDNEGYNINWSGKDTIWGPMNTNGSIQFSGNSVFHGEVSIGGAVTYNRNHPIFDKGLIKNYLITLPASGIDTVKKYAGGGYQFTGHSVVYFEFRKDSVRYRYSTSGSGSTWTYKLASTFAPNGVILANNAELHISGTVQGKYTIAASGTSGNLGDVYLDDDIKYYIRPDLTLDPPGSNSTDMLGIIANSDVIVTDNVPNNSNITIEAAIYAGSGSFKVQNYDQKKYYPLNSNRGFINLFGGITQKTRGAVGTGDGNTISTGYGKRYRYDERLLYSHPSAYPGVGTFEIVSWFE